MNRFPTFLVAVLVSLPISLLGSLALIAHLNRCENDDEHVLLVSIGGSSVAHAAFGSSEACERSAVSIAVLHARNFDAAPFRAVCEPMGRR